MHDTRYSRSPHEGMMHGFLVHNDLAQGAKYMQETLVIIHMKIRRQARGHDVINTVCLCAHMVYRLCMGLNMACAWRPEVCMICAILRTA